MSNKVKFGDRLRERRTERGLLQRELADKIGISNRNISSYEKNDREPSYDVLVNLAEALDCSTDYLLGSVDVPNHFRGEIQGNKYDMLIDESEPNKPYSKDKFEKLIKKLESVGFDVSKLLDD